MRLTLDRSEVMTRNGESIIIVGPEEITAIIRKDLEKHYKVKVLEVITENYSTAADTIMRHWPDAVFCALPSDHPDAVNMYHACELTFCTFYFIIKPNPHSERLITCRWCKEPLKKTWAKFVKRTFDILVSGLFLITIYPFVYIICAICIKASGPGPVYFKQLRPGFHGENFECYKFRSMNVNAQSDSQQATKGDARVTKFGSFMRKTSIDELPQFINVLKGDMSIVGPRPQLLNWSDYFAPKIPNFFMRHLVKPGITGWAQVNGCRGECYGVEDVNDRINNDIWYIENWTPWLDIKILFMTVKQIAGGDEQAY